MFCWAIATSKLTSRISELQILFQHFTIDNGNGTYLKFALATSVFAWRARRMEIMNTISYDSCNLDRVICINKCLNPNVVHTASNLTIYRCNMIQNGWRSKKGIYCNAASLLLKNMYWRGHYISFWTTAREIYQCVTS